MTLIRRTNPLGELLSLRQAMDRLFEDSFVRTRGGTGEEIVLPLDVYTTADALVVEAALPGVNPDDVDVSVLGDTLTISASSRQEQQANEGGYSYREIRRGSMSRTLTLPSGVNAEAASASFENGLLRLSIPRAEETKPRSIRIETTGNGTSHQASRPEDGPSTSADEQGR
ncbi:MAG TPA: Hsp20/alpha crystallin family protein [Candidatus Caenarcaniphilales bacterium]|nr:Hsp20/alpha crystallin family protein [Candidatus Caenarcaniphilales bacterium]